MKIRNDYVSNSSSSSFIVGVPVNVELDKFINAIAVADPRKVVTGTLGDEITKRNVINLNYCLRNYELLFLGGLTYGKYVHEYIGDELAEERDRISNIKKMFDSLNEQYDDYQLYGGKVVVDEPDKLVVEYNQTASYITLKKDGLSTLLDEIYSWTLKEDKDEITKSNVEHILELCEFKEKKWRFMGDNSGLFAITLNTISTTRDLLSSGCQLVLPKWIDQYGGLDGLEKKINDDGYMFFGIEVGRDGNGEDSRSIYSLSGFELDCPGVDILSGEWDY